MNSCYQSVVLILLLICILFSGCSVEEVGGSAMGSQVWETMPTLTYSEMKCEKLTVLPWNSGRCEATGFDTIAETENGYYMTKSMPYTLVYADKSDLSNWLPVCAKPDCSHNSPTCNAYMSFEGFTVRDNHIIYQLHTSSGETELYSGGADTILVSMAPDGSNKKFVFAFDQYIPATRASSVSLLDSRQWFYNMVELNANGTQTAHAYRVTEQGQEEYATVEDYKGSPILQTAEFYLHLYGDKIYLNTIVNASRSVYFRFGNGALEPIDTANLPVQFSYLSGDTLRFFKINDGYYDMNIKTGEQIKLADAQLQNSFANIMLPNCIIESTLMTYRRTGNTDYYTEGMSHQMRLFDGERWRDVELPEQLLYANGKTFVIMKCVASDCIILYGRDMETYPSTQTTDYYRIDLNNKNLKLELIAQLTTG